MHPCPPPPPSFHSPEYSYQVLLSSGNGYQLVHVTSRWTTGLSYGCHPEYGHLLVALNQGLRAFKATYAYSELCTRHRAVHCDCADCQVGEWSAWGPCSRRCDGTQRRSRTVVSRRDALAVDCPSSEESQGCSEENCEPSAEDDTGFLYLFDGCPTGGLVRSERLVSTFTTKSACEYACNLDHTCNAIEVDRLLPMPCVPPTPTPTYPKPHVSPIQALFKSHRNALAYPTIRAEPYANPIRIPSERGSTQPHVLFKWYPNRVHVLSQTSPRSIYGNRNLMRARMTPGRGGVRGQKEVWVPKIDLKFPVALINFTFRRRKKFLMWEPEGVGGSAGGCPGPQTTPPLPPPPPGSLSNGLLYPFPNSIQVLSESNPQQIQIPFQIRSKCESNPIRTRPTRTHSQAQPEPTPTVRIGSQPLRPPQVNGCLNGPDCQGQCWHFAGNGSDIRSAGCIMTGDQKTFLKPSVLVFHHLFDGCPMGGLVRHRYSVATSKSRTECLRDCFIDPACHAIEINGCLGGRGCQGQCSLFSGAGRDVYNGACVTSGDQRTYLKPSVRAECDRHHNPCARNARCEIVAGRYNCTCREGAVGDGYHCSTLSLTATRTGSGTRTATATATASATRTAAASRTPTAVATAPATVPPSPTPSHTPSGTGTPVPTRTAELALCAPGQQGPGALQFAAARCVQALSLGLGSDTLWTRFVFVRIVRMASGTLELQLIRGAVPPSAGGFEGVRGWRKAVLPPPPEACMYTRVYAYTSRIRRVCVHMYTRVYAYTSRIRRVCVHMCTRVYRYTWRVRTHVYARIPVYVACAYTCIRAYTRIRRVYVACAYTCVRAYTCIRRVCVHMYTRVYVYTSRVRTHVYARIPVYVAYTSRVRMHVYATYTRVSLHICPKRRCLYRVCLPGETNVCREATGFTQQKKFWPDHRGLPVRTLFFC